MTIPAIAVGIIRIQSPMEHPEHQPADDNGIERFFHHPPRPSTIKYAAEQHFLTDCRCDRNDQNQHPQRYAHKLILHSALHTKKLFRKKDSDHTEQRHFQKHHADPHHYNTDGIDNPGRFQRKYVAHIRLCEPIIANTTYNNRDLPTGFPRFQAERIYKALQ